MYIPLYHSHLSTWLVNTLDIHMTCKLENKKETVKQNETEKYIL